MQQTTSHRPIRLLLATLAAVLVLAACSGGEDLGGPLLELDADALQATSAEVMGEVQSVRFGVERTGAPVFVDGAQSIALDNIDGRFSVPGSADAILSVTVAGSLRTELGAVAIDDEVWLSNPTTGRFETLPPGFDIDPSLFFDPVDGWRPLIAGLSDVAVVGEETRNDATRYHLTGVAPAEAMASITAGLVSGQDVELDLWLNPVTAEVTSIEFQTEFDGEVSDWVLDLTEYGETFDISPPEE